MFRLSRLIASTAAAIALLTSVSAAQAITVASKTYYFYGTCLDCTLNSAPGAPIAALELVGNYLEGTPIQDEDFVSFEYVGSDLVFAYTVRQEQDLPNGIKGLDTIDGSMDSASGGRDFSIGFGGDGQLFASLSNGSWFTCSNGPDGYYSGSCSLTNNNDFGRDGTWNQPTGNRVPEPATLALVALGLAASLRRRKAA